MNGNEDKGRERKSLSLPMFRFDEPGTTLVGKVVEKSEREIDGRTRGRYVFADENGETWVVFGTVQLDDALERASRDAVIEIVYIGTEDAASGYPVKQFQVSEFVD